MASIESEKIHYSFQINRDRYKQKLIIKRVMFVVLCCRDKNEIIKE